MQRRLHDAEQALAAERALRYQQGPHPPPLPPPPPPHQSSGPSRGNNGQPAYRFYGANLSDKFAECERKEELKAHQIELFDGKLDLEGLQKWFRTVEHYGRLTGYSERRVIERSGNRLLPRCLTDLRLCLGASMSDFPPPRYPFGWHELKARQEATYASPSSVSYVWRDLASFKRRRDVATFHSHFTELALLVGESPDSAIYGSRLWDVYNDKMSVSAAHPELRYPYGAPAWP